MTDEQRARMTKLLNREIKEMKTIDAPDKFTSVAIMLRTAGIRTGYETATEDAQVLVDALKYVTRQNKTPKQMEAVTLGECVTVCEHALAKFGVDDETK